MSTPLPGSTSPPQSARLNPDCDQRPHTHRNADCLFSHRRAPNPIPPLERLHARPGIARSVQPELLDRIPVDAPEARASRRDLRVINHLLGSMRWFRRKLREHHLTREGVLEIGAGGGQLARALNATTPNFAGLDFHPRPPDWPQQARWFQTNVMDFDRWVDYPVVISNLFLHHFDRADLAYLGARLNAHTRVLIASDPLRIRRAHTLLALVCPLIRAHPVTRHDARVSITAGFRGDELARHLQLDPRAWHWRSWETWLGSCRLVAVRRP